MVVEEDEEGGERTDARQSRDPRTDRGSGGGDLSLPLDGSAQDAVLRLFARSV
jgi:hypothetical protein